MKAKNRSKMKFYIMWANHSVPFLWDRRICAQHLDELIWRGSVSLEDFKKFGKYWIDEYFSQPEYYQIDGKPVVSIYDIWNLLISFGSIQGVKDAMDWLDNEAKKSGFNGIHYQWVITDEPHKDMYDGDKPITKDQLCDFVKAVPFSSYTHYQWCAFKNMNRDYNEIAEDAYKEWDRISELLDIPYFTHVSVGWDNTPRYYNHIDNVVKNNTPENVEKAFLKAKEYATSKGQKLITVNSWNEWTETSYLEPDDLYGYGYLEALKKVFVED